MWSVATILDRKAPAHHSAYLNSEEHVQTEKLNRHVRPTISVSSLFAS